MNGHIMLNKHSKIPGGNIGMFIAIQDSEYEVIIMMKQIIVLSMLSIFVFGISYAQEKSEDFPVLKGPYLGQKPPEMTPEKFAPGIISTAEYTELSCTFSPNGKEFYFTRYTPDRNIWVCRLKDDVWQKPEPASFNSNYREISPHITADGHMLFFGSTRPHPQRQGDPKNWSMWVTRRGSNGWEEPQYIGRGIYLTTSKIGNIYLSDFDRGNIVILQTRFVKGRFSEFLTLDGGVNSPFHDNHPCIAPDESYIIFESNRPGSQRGGNTFDLYICYKKKNGTWSQAINIGKVLDTKSGSTLPYISPDGKYLFYNSISDTGKKADIFWVDAKIIKVLKPKKLK